MWSFLLFWQEIWGWNMSTWVGRCLAYYKLSVAQIIFLSTTNFTFPQAPFYNINSLTDNFRWKRQKCQIKLTSCGLPAAEHILISQPVPARAANTPVWLRPAVTNHKIKYISGISLRCSELNTELLLLKQLTDFIGDYFNLLLSQIHVTNEIFWGREKATSVFAMNLFSMSLLKL